MRPTDYCPECAHPTEARSDRHKGAVCTHCGASLVDPETARWVNVARVTNLAEAGFLVDELAGDGIDARIYQSDEFSALSDRWLVNYLIQSPPGAAPAAAARIRQHLAEADPYPDPVGDDYWPVDRPAIDPLLWRPMALVLLAGVTSFVLGQRLAAERAARPPRNALSSAISAIGRPLVTEPAAGLARHRLYYQWRDQAWYLETDADADGTYETRQRFHAAGSRW